MQVSLSNTFKLSKLRNPGTFSIKNAIAGHNNKYFATFTLHQVDQTKQSLRFWGQWINLYIYFFCKQTYYYISTQTKTNIQLQIKIQKFKSQFKKMFDLSGN